MRVPILLATLALTTAGMPAMVHAMPTHDASAYLEPVFHDGARYDNVFSRTIALKAKGFEDKVRRVSGSARYRVRPGAAPAERLQIDYRYDGLQHGSGQTGFRDDGATACYEGTCHPNTDASGLIYNPLIWGTPPAHLRVGQQWVVQIPRPWELGPAGRQTVTVVALDPDSFSVTLKREGGGDGFYLGDKPTVTLTRGNIPTESTLRPGHSHWYGYTTFRRGIVVSDELMVERPVTLESAGGQRVHGRERQYILLNAMPVAADEGG